MDALTVIESPREPATSTYHGVQVTEDYRWLEENSDRTVGWTAAQTARTRAYLDALPFREEVRARCEAILRAESTTYSHPARGGTTLFALKLQPPRQQPYLVALPSLDDVQGERCVVDPSALDASGATTIDWYVPSPDGTLVAVSLSSNGTEDGTLHVYATETGELQGEVIPRVSGATALGSLAWRSDGQGFWYTRYPTPGEVPDEELAFHQEVWFHRVGDSPDQDRRELAGVFSDDRIVENFLTSSPDGTWVMDRAQKGDGGEWEIFVRRQEGESTWRQIASIDDECIRAVFGDGELFLLSTNDAINGRVLRLSLAGGSRVSDAETVVEEGTVTIENIAATDQRLWVCDIDGGLSGIRVFDHQGHRSIDISLPDVCGVNPLLALGSDEVIWAQDTYLSPRQWWACRDTDEQPRPTALDTRTGVEFTGMEVERLFATSRDGTQIPISLIRQATATRDGSTPTILYGYGGYGLSIRPSFDPSLLVWLEQGGVYAVAGIRGGGEYGKSWHEAGRLANKQNCFDDLIACAEHLVGVGVTSEERLALMGGSNGGLLVGAVLTQRPDIAAAVLCAVPVLDVLRSELSPNGVFNVEEFGTVADPEMFQVLHAYSPYHNVRDGVAYPAVLFTTGELDPRVEAWHAKKMTARLQAATSSEAPILLRVEQGGHGIGRSLDQLVGLVADYYTFFFDRLLVSSRR